MAKIIVAGHVCLDITPVFSAEKVLPLQKIMVPGKLTQMKDITLSTGGVVANTGLALKFLGADVELMGKIGKDELGQIVYSRFQKYNAEKGLIVSKDSSTSYTIAIAPPGTDRIFLHNPGANDTFSLEDLDMIYEGILTEIGVRTTQHWYSVYHTFALPFYYISYAVSAFNALEIFVDALDDYDAAVAEYLQVNQYQEEGYIGMTAGLGMMNAFDEGDFAQIMSALYEHLFGQSEDVPTYVAAVAEA